MTTTNANILRRSDTSQSNLESILKNRQWGLHEDLTDGSATTNQGKLIAKDSSGKFHRYLTEEDIDARILAGAGSGSFVEINGNTLGSALNLGTNDAYSVFIETDSVNRVEIDTSGNVYIGGADGTVLNTTKTANFQAKSTANYLMSLVAGTNGEANYSVENDARQYRWGVGGSDEWFMYDDTADKYVIYRNTSGFFGIGDFNPATRSPRTTLDVFLASSSQLRLTYEDNVHYTNFWSNGSGNLNIYPSNKLVAINPTGTNPLAHLHVYGATNPQLRLSYEDGTDNTHSDFQTDSSGNLTITPSGGQIKLAAGQNHSNSIKTTNYTITIADYYIGADGTSNTVTITMPASPTGGDTYLVDCINDTFQVDINWNGNNYKGSSTNTLLPAGADILLTFNGTEWRG